MCTLHSSVGSVPGLKYSRFLHGTPLVGEHARARVDQPHRHPCRRPPRLFRRCGLAPAAEVEVGPRRRGETTARRVRRDLLAACRSRTRRRRRATACSPRTRRRRRCWSSPSCRRPRRVTPASRTVRPVPLSTTARSIDVIWNASRGSITVSAGAISAAHSTVPSAASMRRTRRGRTRSPPLANGAYAATSSSGVTSTRTERDGGIAAAAGSRCRCGAPPG